MARDAGALRHLWLSPWTVWVGLRYLKSKKNSRFLSFISILSMLGVLVGVTAMTVVLSVMDGFEDKMKGRLMSSDLHVLISPTSAVTGFDSGYVPSTALNRSLLEGPGVAYAWAVVSAELMLKAGRKVKGIAVKGVDDLRLARLKTQVIESADPQLMVSREGGDILRLPGVFIGQELAYEMELIPGDQIVLISPTETEGPLDSIPRMKKFAIEGIYRSGIPEQELYAVFATDKAVRSFLRRQDVVSQWEITLEDFYGAPALANVLRSKLVGFRVQDWTQLNASLFASLKLERVSMFVFLAFIIIVASFNIVTTLTLMVLEKKKEISIMKAMGARHGQVAAIFLAEGVFIGVIGTAFGLVLGLLLCLALKRWEFIELPKIYYDTTLPVAFNAFYYFSIAASALIIVLAACLYPSRRAAELNPLDGIRFG
jgi:lipoprotein-releasing system permease protein